MKQYFTWDSTLFTIIAVGIIVTGSPILLMIFAVLSIVLLIVKSGIKIEKQKPDDWGVWSILIYGGIFATVLFGFFGLALILFGYWFYILMLYLTR